jgi:hypothetical protein
VTGRRFVAIALVELLQRVVALSRIGLCRVGVKSGGDGRDDAAPHARFAPKADKQPNISVRPLCADIVAEVCSYSSELAAWISRNGSHHPLFAER